MIDFVKTALDALKMPTKIIFVVCFVTGNFLFLPDNWITALRVDSFVKDYGQFIGVVFIVTATLFIINVLSWAWRLIQGFRRERARKQAIHSNMETLDNYEKAVLREFYIQGRNVIELPIDNPVVAGLLEKDIVSIVSEFGKQMVGMLFPVSLSSTALNLIKRNPQIIGIPLVDKLTQEQRKAIMNSRPSFVREIEYRNWLRTTPDLTTLFPPDGNDVPFLSRKIEQMRRNQIMD